MSKENGKSRGGPKEEHQRVTTAPEEQVVYEGVLLSELPQDRLYAKLGQLIEEIEYRRETTRLKTDAEVKIELQEIAKILSKHIIRYKLSAEQNAALAASVRQIRDKLEVAPAAPEPRAVAAQAPAQKAEARPVAEELFVPEDVEATQIDPDIIFRVFEEQKQISVITELLKDPGFDPGSHKLRIALTRSGTERSMYVIQYLAEEQDTIKQLYAAGVFDSDKNLRDMVQQGILKLAVLFVLCNERKNLRELQLAEEAGNHPLVLEIMNELDTIAQDIAAGEPVDYKKTRLMLEGRSAKIADELALAGTSAQLSEIFNELQKKLDQQIKVLSFYEQLSIYGPKWEKIIEGLPPSNREMAKRGITLEQMKATKDNLQELYEQMKKSGLLEDDGTQGGAITALKRQIKERTQEALKLIDEQLLVLPDPQQMTIAEVVRELLGSSGIYSSDIRYPKLKNRYEAELRKITDPYERALYVNAIATLSAAVAGTSSANDYAANLNKVEKPFAQDNGTMQTLALMFFEGSDEQRSIKEFLDGNVPIDTRAIELWDFIVSRIKNLEKFGGSSSTVIDLIPQNPGESDAEYKLRLAIIERSKNDDAKLSRLLPALTGETSEERRVRIHKIKTGSSMSRFEYDEQLVKKLPTESDEQFRARLQKIASIDQSFSYGSLMEHVVGDFEKLIDLVFADIDPTKREILKSFYKTFGAKSAAYVVYLMRGTTRGHGFAPEETIRDDEARYDNPFALRMYKATRYDKLTRARFMSRFMYLPKSAFVALLAQSFDKNYPAKAESAKEMYELYELFYKSRWGAELPLWLTEGRKLFTSDDFADIEIPEHMDEHEFEEWIEELREKRIFDGAAIDLDSTVFPLIPDVATSVMRIEQQKTELLQKYEQAKKDKASRKITQQAFVQIENSFNADVEAFVEKYRYQGYFNYSNLTKAERANDHVAMLKACFGQRILMGGQDSPNFTVVQYGLAAKAVDKMFETFDAPMKANMTVAEAEHTMKEWCESYIGKAKLVPGPHHLLFAPFTCELLTNILNSFEDGDDKQKVAKLYRELMQNFIKAGGLPAYVYEEVVRLMGGDEKNPPDYCVYAHRNRPLFGPDPYLRLLWLVENEADISFSANAGRLNPLHAPGPWRSPFAHEEAVGKDATQTGGESAKH